MRLLKKLFGITPFKLSILITLVFLGLSIIYDVNPTLIGFLQTIDHKSLDLKFKLRGYQKPKSKIVIVAADEKAFQAFGQWPFDRGSVFAPALDRLCQFNPKIIGMDIVWADVENKMPIAVRSAISSILGSKANQLEDILVENSGDAKLKQAMQTCAGKVILGYALTREMKSGHSKAEFDKRMGIILQGNNTIDTRTRGKIIFSRWPGDPQANVDFHHVAASGVLNLPTITTPSMAQGFFINEGDNDGNYRRALLLYRANDTFVSSLTLRMAQKALSPNDSRPHLSIQGDLPEQGQAQEFRLELPTPNGLKRIPTDTRGQTLINYRGPNHMFPNISLADLLSADPKIEYDLVEPNGELKHFKIHKSELFKDALIFMGVTAIGLYDIRPRPFDPTASGVENHASILDNILGEDFLSRPSTELLAKLWILLFVLSILYGFIIGKLNAKLGAIFAATSIGGLLYFDQVFLFNRREIVFPGHLQAIQLLCQYLAITVLKYIQEESEKKFIRSAFDKYVSPAIVDSMLQDPTKLKLGGEKKELSILFSDIRSFTEISEKMDVKALTGLLNEYLGAMTEILQKNNGTLDKYIGDAVMGFWGAPVDVKEHASSAVKTAVEMLNRVDELNGEFHKKYGLRVDIGVGINSGPVSVGNFGSNKVFEYTVIGDNVNLASRLEGLNKYYGTHIIISEFTQTLLKDQAFHTREVDTVKVKGKQKPVKIYEVFPDNAAHATLKSAVKTFNEGLMQYYARQWERAMQSFQSVLSIRQNDKPSLEMIERIKYYVNNPPASNWDGSWEMHTK